MYPGLQFVHGGSRLKRPNVGALPCHKTHVPLVQKGSNLFFSIGRLQLPYYYRKSTQNPLPFLGYLEEITTTLIFQIDLPQNIRSDVLSRLSERHFPDKVPPTASGGIGKKKCKVCASDGVRRETVYYCAECPSQPGLCVVGCFRRYHTSLNY